MGDLLQGLLERAAAKGSRSTALQPLLWLASILLLATVAAAGQQATGLLLYVLIGLSVVVVLAALASYFYLMFQDRDALRSEKFKLDKMRIERGMWGDSVSGVEPRIGEQMTTVTLPKATTREPLT